MLFQNLNGNFQTKLFDNILSANFGFKNISNAQGRIPDRLCFIGLNGNIGFANIVYPVSFWDSNSKFFVGYDRTLFNFTRNADQSLNQVLAPAEMLLSKLNFGYEFQKNLFDNHNLLFGINTNIESAQNVSGIKFFSDNSVVYNQPTFNTTIQDEWSLTTNDKLYIGALLSKHYISNFSFSPLLSFIHKFDSNNVFRIGTFTSSRNPNVFEHSMQYDQDTGSLGKVTKVTPNKNLLSERTTSYEVGFRSQILENIFVSTDLYLNQVRNGIEWSLIGSEINPARPEYKSENSLEQNIGGGEAVIKYQMNKYFSLENNLSYTKVISSSNKKEYQGTSGNGINNVGQGRFGDNYVPSFIYNALLNFNWEFINANLQYQYTSAHTWQWPLWNPKTTLDDLQLKPVQAYGILNTHIGFNLIENVGISLDAYNLLDNQHTEWRGDESYFGRQFYSTLNLKF